MGSYSVDVDQSNFEQVVIEGSKKAPVIVDFWAGWCGPCKQLKPILEKLAEEYQGRFILAKLDTEKNVELANGFGIRGIPNVKAFVNGALVDEFSGALPESAVREFIDRLIPSPAEKWRKQAAAARAAGDPEKALQLLGEASRQDAKNEWVRVDAGEILLDMGRMDEAKHLLESLSPDLNSDGRVQQMLAKLQFAAAEAGGADAVALRERITRNENDLQARLDLANLLIAGGQYEAGMDELLEIVRRDRTFQDDAARKTLLSVFNLLGGQGELVSHYRRLLASALNA
jgi:putative thioredoxin